MGEYVVMADFRKKDARSVAFPHFAENELTTVSTIEKTLGTLVFSKLLGEFSVSTFVNAGLGRVKTETVCRRFPEEWRYVSFRRTDNLTQYV